MVFDSRNYAHNYQLTVHVCWLDFVKISFSLFNAIPPGAIEVLTDENNLPNFKRADLGRYLGIVDGKTSLRNINIETKTRYEMLHGGRHGVPPYSKVKTIMMSSLVWRLLWRLLCGLPYRFVSLLDLQKKRVLVEP